MSEMSEMSAQHSPQHPQLSITLTPEGQHEQLDRLAQMNSAMSHGAMGDMSGDISGDALGGTAEAPALLLITAGVYERPIQLTQGYWSLRYLEGEGEAPLMETDEAEGAPLQWRGPALLIGPQANVRVEGVRLHARLSAEHDEGREGSEGNGADRVDQDDQIDKESSPQGAIRCEGTLELSSSSLSASHGHALVGCGPCQLTLHHVRLHHAGRCGLYLDAGEAPQESKEASQQARLTCKGCYFEWNGSDKATHSALTPVFTHEQDEERDEELETDGVWLTGHLTASFYACVFAHNQGDGLYAKEGDVRLIESELRRNGVNGAYAGEGARLEVQGCLLSESVSAGLGVKGGHLSVESTTLKGGEGVGLFVIERGHLNARALHISGHKREGVLVMEGAEDAVRFEELVCQGDQQHGVVIEQTKGVKLIKVQISGHSSLQLLCARAEVFAEELNVSGGRFGVGVEGGRCTLRGVEVSEASEAGLLFKGLDDGEESAYEAPHEVTHLKVSAREGLALLVSQKTEVRAQGGSITDQGRTAEGPQELVAALHGAKLSLSDLTLSGELIGVRAQGSEVHLERCQLKGFAEVALLARDGAHLSAIETQIEGVMSEGLINEGVINEGVMSDAHLSLKEVQTHTTLQPPPLSAYGRSGAGVWVMDAQLSLTACKLTRQRRSQCVLVGQSEARLTACELYDGGDAGLLAASGARVSVEGGVIEGQRGAGLWLEGRAQLTASDLSVHAQQSGGLFAREASTATLTHCTFLAQRKAAVMSEQGSVVHMSSCALREGQDAGLLVEEGSAAQMTGGVIEGMALVGAAVKAGATLSLEGVEVSGGDVGVLALEGSKGRVQGCWIYDQHQAALLVHALSLMTVEGNTHQSMAELLSGPQH